MPTYRARLGAVLVTAVLALAVTLAGCGSDSDDADSGAASEPTASPNQPSESPSQSDGSPSGSPSDSASVAEQTTVRSDFCSRIPDAAVRAALDAKSAYDETWKPGVDGFVKGGVHKTKAEYGCAWTARDGTTAMAWVLARPVTPTEAERYDRLAARGCATKSAPRHGKPGVTVQCIFDDDTVTRAQGLFDDAYLSCSVQTPGILTKMDRAFAWCAAVRTAALG